jgi:alpha-galactosidase/6-phospho-beta-glucosidase family protein
MTGGKDGSQLKVVVLGAASSNFGPGLLHRLASSPVLEGATLSLVDRDRRRLEQVSGLTRAVAAEVGLDVVVEATVDRREALPGARFVVVAIAVGGLEAWESDIELSGKHGVFMEVADTVGPGGFFRALRHAPVVHDIAADVAELAPKAWLLSYTNPEGVCTMAMSASGHTSSASLCTCVCDLARGRLAAAAGVEGDELALPPMVAGINHLAGIVDLRTKDGEGVFAHLAESKYNELGLWATERYGVVPYCADHWFEFHVPLSRPAEPYRGRSQGLRLRRGQVVRDMDLQRSRVDRWTAALDAAAAGRLTPGGQSALGALPPEDPDKPVQVLDVIASIVADEGRLFVANVTNGGAVPALPEDAVVEVAVRADAYGLRPLAVPRLSRAFVAKLIPNIVAQQLTCAAALSGDADLARRAFLADPVVDALLEPEEATALFDEMLEANRPYLPRFAR